MSTPLPDRRPDPDALLAAAQSQGKGHLKIFLGAAPGVGKTWEMLAAARHAVQEGRDVLIGLVESHGRAGTEEQIGDLPLLPRRHIPYHGQMLEEFDLDAALARHPDLLLIDELAHTNVPGSRHRKRWEDVVELVEAGINVWTTLNVQHLESLNDAVARITGVRVSETLPDQVLDLAAEIELIDLAPSELRARMERGKIYRPDQARRALRSFFRTGNLTALRELALRRAAEHVDVAVRDYMRARGISGPWPAAERVLALVGEDATADAVVREASRLAKALHAPWIALTVERGQAGQRAQAARFLAERLGAEPISAPGTNLLAEVLELAGRRNVTQIVIGRGRPPWWRRRFRRTLADLLLRHAGAYSLHVVPLPVLPAPVLSLPAAASPPWWRPAAIPWVATPGLIGTVTLLTWALRGVLPADAASLIYLAAVVAAATIWGLGPGLFAAAIGFLAWNFFFLPPVFTFSISDPRDIVAAIVFLGVAAVTGFLAGRVQREARVAKARVESLRRIGLFSRRLGAPATEPDLLLEIAEQAAAIAGAAIILLGSTDDLTVRVTLPPGETLDEAAWAAARRCITNLEPTGAETATLPSVPWHFLPLRSKEASLGVLGTKAAGGLDQPMSQSLVALADQASLAIERVRFAGKAARAAAQADTQKLRTALLSSLSHDLRTPLASILGAAGTLHETWDHLDAPTRADLLSSIEEDVGRMTRLLANIAEMTRLETGEIVPKLVPTDLAVVVEAAIARVPGTLLASVSLPEGLPPVLADPVLLEQSLVNLLENAVKFSPADGMIAVRAETARGEVALSVSDAGIGIPAEDLAHVFESFYRSGRGDQVAPGTGLGLAIARGLIEAMGGRIVAVSPRPDAPADGSNPGTVITIWLPTAGSGGGDAG